MSNFTNISNTSLFECDDSGDGKFIAFYKKEGTVDLNQPVPAETIWTDCVGYYLFLHQRPGNLEQFASDVDGHIGTFEQGAGRGGFLWLDYSDGLEEVGHILTEKETNGQGNEDDEVTAITDVTIEFANYRLPIKTGMVVEYDDTWLDGICFTILYPPDPEPSCPDTAVAPGADPDYALYLWLTGVKFGCFEGIGIINDYFSTDATTSWDIVIRYAVKIEDDTVHQLYPIFDVSSGKRPLYTMCWDPLDHLNPDRTYLKFKGTSVLFEKDGPGECDYKLGVPDDPEIIPTYFRTVTGETMAFIAVTGGDHPAKLVFEVFQEEGENTDLRYYLVPCGEFETVVISSSGSMIDSGSGETEFPGKFLCGLSGIESVGFHPKTSTGSGDKIRFYPKHPAYAPLFPIIPIDAEAPAGDPMPTTPILTDTFRTAWAGFTPGTASGLTRNLYFAQPEDAPLYIDRVPPWIWDARAFLTLLEPKAEEIPSTTQAINQDVGEHCFPLAPATKAVPATAVAGDARKTFLIDVERQIISTSRRARIHKLVGNVVDALNTPVTDIAATPQGVVATISDTGWPSLLLAKNNTGTRLEFTRLNHTLRAAFQTNQFFLVASLSTYLHQAGATTTKFLSSVKIADWTFNLNVAQNNFRKLNDPGADDFRDLNNTVIFKFGPGRIIDRVRNPKAWTMPEDFNRKEDGEGNNLLNLLSQRLAAFIARAKEKAEDDVAYRRFVEVVEDEKWTGVIGINVGIQAGDLPEPLQVLTAGTDAERFVAHHIVVETGMLEASHVGGMDPAECSVFGLVDYLDDSAGTQPSPPPEFTFNVKKFRAYFSNGTLKEFTAQAELTINRLFGESILTQTPPTNKLTLDGYQESRNGNPTYMFKLSGLGAIRMDSKLIHSVDIRKSEFSASSITMNGAAAIQADFSLWGALKFCDVGEGATKPFDVYSYEALPFEGLVLTFKFPKTDPQQRTPSSDYTAVKLDGSPTSVRLRPNSLVKRFPMRLLGFTTSGDINLPRQSGYVNVATPEGVSFGTLAGPWYGLEFELNLGTLGDIASNSGIAVRVMLAWSASQAALNGKIFLKFPGVSAAQNELLSIEGVIRLGANSYELRSYTDTGKFGYMLMIKDMALRVLGIAMPPGVGTDIFIFGNPNQAPLPNTEANQLAQTEDTLGWFAIYRA